jgi:hypothetical protein
MKRVIFRAACLIGLLALAPAGLAEAGTSPLVLGYLGSREQPLDPPSPLDHVAEDEGAAGVRLGIADSNTTGRFTGQVFALTERWLEPGADVGAAVRAFRSQGIRFVIADLPAEGLLAVADAGRAEGTLALNVRASDDRLRNEDCRENVLHIAPSRAMPADALRRSARRFGAKIAAEKIWSFRFGPGRADTGHVVLQTEIPAFTRVADHDVLVVADEANVFGEYLSGRTALPRPVVGTHGILATTWSPVHEQWGAMQLQKRFRRQAGRGMTARDYAA